jgi:hypothetical protein
MKCKECNGTGFVIEWGMNYTDGDECPCPKCNGEGELYDPRDKQPWDMEHSGWGRFEAHNAGKWKTRFVLSGCDRNYTQIVHVLKITTGFDYSYLSFDEEKLFPCQDTSYIYPCVYFFPKDERDISTPPTKSEVEELYWY